MSSKARGTAAGTLHLSAPRRPWLSGRAILALNLSLALISGTLICFWVWYYTDYIEEFGAVLTLGGALSWLAFMLRVIPEDRTKKVQDAFFSMAFENHGALPWQGLAMASVVAVLFCFATVQIESVRESTELAVAVADEKEAVAGNFWEQRLADEDFEVLQPGHRLRVVIPVWWGLRRHFTVSVKGYPEKVVSLRPWSRRDLIAPSSFRRPVILLRPSATLLADNESAKTQSRKLQLTVKKIGQEKPLYTGEIPFRGRSIWLNSGISVEVPAALRSDWQKEAGWLAHGQEWIFPETVKLAGVELQKGQQIDIALLAPNGQSEWSISVGVDFDATRLEFSPQVIVVGIP